MNEVKLEDVNVNEELALITPEALHRALPLGEQGIKTVKTGRQEVQAILDRRDHRLIVVAGPCSIHDVAAAHEYAERLLNCAKRLAILFVLSCAFTLKNRAPPLVGKA